MHIRFSGSGVANEKLLWHNIPTFGLGEWEGTEKTPLKASGLWYENSTFGPSMFELNHDVQAYMWSTGQTNWKFCSGRKQSHSPREALRLRVSEKNVIIYKYLSQYTTILVLMQLYNICRGLQIMKLLIRKLSLASSDFLPLGPDNTSPARYNWPPSSFGPPFLWETRFHIRAEEKFS